LQTKQQKQTNNGNRQTNKQIKEQNQGKKKQIKQRTIETNQQKQTKGRRKETKEMKNKLFKGLHCESVIKALNARHMHEMKTDID